MDEVERLQNELRLAFSAGTKMQLSERNMIEILLKLRDLKLIEFIHTLDGKEYLTPIQIEREASSELVANNGRISLSDLKNRINVDFNHIEDAVARLLKKDSSITKLQGELISTYYLDNIAEEINESLQESGRIEMSDVSKQYSLPSDFVEQVITRRLNSMIQGRLKQDVLYTQAYVERLQHRIKGIFYGVTRPTDVSFVIQKYRLTDPIIFDLIDEASKKGDIPGSLIGKRERSQYIPHIFVKNRDRWIENLYRHNKYLDYDSVRKLYVGDAKKYLAQKFPDGIALDSCYVSKDLCQELNTNIEVSLEEEGWKDAHTILSIEFSETDLHQLLCLCESISSKSGLLLESRYVVSPAFLEKLLASLRKKVDEDQLELAREGKLVIHANVPESALSDDEADTGKKKSAKGGKASKGKASKKSKDEDFEPKAKPAAKKTAAKASQDDRIDLPESYLEDYLQSTFKGVDADLLHIVVSENRHSIVQYQATAREAAIKAMFDEHQQNANYDGLISALYEELAYFQKSHAQIPDEAGIISKHLLKTLCTDITLLVAEYQATTYLVDIRQEKAQEADKAKLIGIIIQKLPRKYQQSLQDLNQALTKKTTEQFIEILEQCASELQLRLKPMDKKKESIYVDKQRQSIIQQIRETSDPAQFLHMTTIFAFYQSFGVVANIPGRAVSVLLKLLDEKADKQLMAQLQALHKQTVDHLRKIAAANQANPAANTETQDWQELFASIRSALGLQVAE